MFSRSRSLSSDECGALRPQFSLPKPTDSVRSSLSEYIMNDVSSPDRNVRLLARSLATCTKRRRRWKKKTKIYRANVKMRVRGAVTQHSMHPLPPFVPIVGLKHYHRVWFSREIRPKQAARRGREQARPNFGTAGETSSHFDRHFLRVGVLLLNIIAFGFP